jgi:hypothetical protein
MPRDPYSKRIISLLLSAAMVTVGAAGAKPAAAQSAPNCQPGYYYASDGYCYPNQQSYAAPPPVYETAPPAYQPPAVFDGLAIGLGLGALFGALASSDDHGGGDRRGGGDHHRAPPDRHDRGHH